MAEAPSVVQLAQQHPELNVIGLGAQDTLSYANDFIARTGTGNAGFTMVWDASFESWRALGIRSQPYWVLYDASGELVTSRPGATDFAAVEAAL